MRELEEQRQREYAALMALPRRARHRLFCSMRTLKHRRYVITVHRLLAQQRTYSIVAYEPQYSLRYSVFVDTLLTDAIDCTLASECDRQAFLHP